MDRCHECSFVYDDVLSSALATTVRGHVPRYRDSLAAVSENLVRVRPDPVVWSALEYSCHVRDVLLAQRERTLLALVEDNPDFAPMYRDDRVALAGYARQTVRDTALQLEVAAEMFATVFDGLSDAQLVRPCIYNYPHRSQRDVTWVGRHTVHELVHHLRDIDHVLRRAKKS